ncbi:hypothetical protein BG004_005192 [Podila humilis]|nr:hypothetical protein BG004_005192 [Podila humilis]
MSPLLFLSFVQHAADVQHRRTSLWEVQLELGEIPGILSPNILEPYPQAVPSSLLLDTNSPDLFTNLATTVSSNKNSYNSLSKCIFYDQDDSSEYESLFKSGDEQELNYEEQTEENRVILVEEDGDEEEFQDEEARDGAALDDYCFPAGIYSYTFPLHPSESNLSLLLPEPLPWASPIVHESAEEDEDERNEHGTLSYPSSPEIIFVRYETKVTILRDGQDVAEEEEEQKKENRVGESKREEMFSVMNEASCNIKFSTPARTATAEALTGNVITTKVVFAALEVSEEENKGDDTGGQVKQEQTSGPSFASALMASKEAQSTSLTTSLKSAPQDDATRQDRKDSGVFVHDTTGIKTMRDNDDDQSYAYCDAAFMDSALFLAYSMDCPISEPLSLPPLPLPLLLPF